MEKNKKNIQLNINIGICILVSMIENMFEWLVKHHLNENLKKCLPHIADGRIHVRGEPLEEGFDENELYKGLLIVSNGSDLINRLERDRVILDEPEDLEEISGENDFFVYISGQRNGDGAYIVADREITKVHEINNYPPSLRSAVPLYSKIPADFLSLYGNVPLHNNIGTKTRLAIKIPHAYESTETYQIKRSAYTDLGMGKVTHFNRQGLVEEFFFVYDPGADAPLFQLERGGITGVYRAYGLDHASKLARTSEQTVDRNYPCFIRPQTENMKPDSSVQHLHI